LQAVQDTGLRTQPRVGFLLCMRIVSLPACQADGQTIQAGISCESLRKQPPNQNDRRKAIFTGGKTEMDVCKMRKRDFPA
jgi:hypothetical protein